MAVIDPGPRLVEAAPYIERWRGATVVVKLGGELQIAGPVIERIVPQLAVLRLCGLRPVVVHGGGAQIDDRCRERGIVFEKVHGRRVTSPAVMEVVLEVVAGELNRQICDLVRADGLNAKGHPEGVSQAVVCQRRPPVEVDGQTVDFGCVGDVVRIDTAPLLDLATIPVLPSVGYDEHGQPVNVNADSVAAKVAVALKAEKLMMLSRVPGVMPSPDADGPYSELSPAQARRLIDEGKAVGGMRAKLNEAVAALEGGVRQVHIVSGVEPHTLLRELFTEEGCGTLIGA